MKNGVKIAESHVSSGVREAVSRAYDIGMHQHRGEIEPFAEWIVGRGQATGHPIQHVLEIGTLRGGTAALWHALCPGRIVSVDLPDGRFGGRDHGFSWMKAHGRNLALTDTLSRFIGVLGDSSSLETFQAVRRAINAPFEDVEPNLATGEMLFDMLFIDGDHTFAGVTADWSLYRRLVRAGGIIAFHDVLDTPLHRREGVEVASFFNAIPGPKAVFSVNGDWGGIGVTFK